MSSLLLPVFIRFFFCSHSQRKYINVNGFFFARKFVRFSEQVTTKAAAASQSAEKPKTMTGSKHICRLLEANNFSIFMAASKCIEIHSLYASHWMFCANESLMKCSRKIQAPIATGTNSLAKKTIQMVHHLKYDGIHCIFNTFTDSSIELCTWLRTPHCVYMCSLALTDQLNEETCWNAHKFSNQSTDEPSIATEIVHLRRCSQTVHHSHNVSAHKHTARGT